MTGVVAASAAGPSHKALPSTPALSSSVMICFMSGS